VNVFDEVAPSGGVGRTAGRLAGTSGAACLSALPVGNVCSRSRASSSRTERSEPGPFQMQPVLWKEVPIHPGQLLLRLEVAMPSQQCL
jgi:hypothetical protein